MGCVPAWVLTLMLLQVAVPVDSLRPSPLAVPKLALVLLTFRGSHLVRSHVSQYATDYSYDGNIGMRRVYANCLPVFFKLGGSYCFGVHVCRVVGGVLVLHGCVSRSFVVTDDAEL